MQLVHTPQLVARCAPAALLATMPLLASLLVAPARQERIPIAVHPLALLALRTHTPPPLVEFYCHEHHLMYFSFHYISERLRLLQ